MLSASDTGMVSMVFHWGVPLLAVLFFAICLLKSGAIVFIPNNSFGVIERRWSMSSAKSPNFMSVNGSPGFLENVIVGGWHFFIPFMYAVHIHELITISEIGYLFARTGANLKSGQALARWPINSDNQEISPENASEFLALGGQRGPQRFILRGGSYAINTALFAVISENGVHMVGDDSRTEIETLAQKINASNGFKPVIVTEDNLAIVTVQDGPAIQNGDVIAPTLRAKDDIGHNGFQDIEAFLKIGGRRGMQEQTLTEGTYYINRLFASIEMDRKQVISIGSVGVVNSYTGPIYSPKGENGTAPVERAEKEMIAAVVPVGYRGIWEEALIPGKYAFNKYAFNIEEVPTTNFQLRWIKSEQNPRDFDAGLSEIRLITQDAFEPILPLTIVVNIMPEDAPGVIQQFSNIERLVNETLDPMLSAWFKDAAQKTTLLELVQQRSELQAQARRVLAERFKNYHLNVREVMIGTPCPAPGDTKISIVLNQLRDRQIAKETTTTLEAQSRTAIKQRELNEVESIANQQSALTASKVEIEVSKNKAEAELQKTRLNAEGVAITAKADAERITVVGEANAVAIKATSDVLGGPEAVLRKVIAEIIVNGLATSGQPLVPSIVAGGENGNMGNVVMAMLAQQGLITTAPAEKQPE